MVGQRHLRAAGPLNYVEVGNYVSLHVPDKATTHPARNLHLIAHEAACSGQRRDVHHRRRDPLEHVDVVALIGREIAACRDRKRNCRNCYRDRFARAEIKIPSNKCSECHQHQ